MNSRSTYTPSFRMRMAAFMLMICFVSFQGMVSYSSYWPTESMSTVLDLDIEKDAKEEVEKETEQWLSELQYALVEEQGFATLYTTCLNTFYQKPYLQVCDPPPEVV